MEDIILAEEHAIIANEKATQLRAEMSRLLKKDKVLFSSKNEGIVFSQLQDAYAAALATAIELQKAMHLLADKVDEPSVLFIEDSPSATDNCSVQFDPVTNIVSCQILSAPILKKRFTAKLFTELIGAELSRKVAETLPQNFVKCRSAYIIFVSHIEGSNNKRQVYFDNDNIAIKGILDCLLPYTCFDDAAKFCQNIYLYNENSASFSEVFIVPDGQLHAWISLHPELKFCQETRQEKS